MFQSCSHNSNRVDSRSSDRVRGRRPHFVIVSSHDDRAPSSATEIATGRMSIKSTRRCRSPVTQIFEPPSMSGHVSPVGVTVTKVVSLLLMLQTPGDLTI